MATLVAVETVAIVLLAVLVCGLLRSHAEIIRTLHRAGLGSETNEEPTPRSAPVAAPAHRARNGAGAGQPAHDLVGTTPALPGLHATNGAEAVHVGVVGARHDTLLAFLSSGCNTCGGFWSALRDRDSLGLPDNTRVVVVTKGPAEESPSRIAELAPSGVRVLMSTAAWTEYRVPVAPYFVHVQGPTGRVVGEGSGNTWAQVVSLLRQAAGDARSDVAMDAKLLGAGIHPGHASLHPSAGGGAEPGR